MNEISWTLNLLVNQGPKFPFSETLQVQAYDKVEVDVPAGGEAKVNVQSGELNNIELLLITCGDRPADAKRLYYTVNDDKAQVDLSKLHLVMGKGAYGLLKNAPKYLTFKNEDANPVTVTILVARKAVDEPPAAALDTTSKGKKDAETKDTASAKTGAEETP